MMNDEAAPSLRVKLGVAALGLLVFVIVTTVADSNLGAAVAFGCVAIVVAVYATWHLRHRAFYWPAMVLFSAAHVGVLLKWHPLIPSPAIKVAPAVVIDFIGMVLLLFALDRSLARREE